jgi:aminopeptidase YwaD
MPIDDFAIKARSYVHTLCSVRPNRRTGSAGNRAATDFVAGTLRGFGYDVDATPFACLDYRCEGASLAQAGETFPVQASPYSLGCDVRAELVAVSTVEELERADCRGKLVLMRGPLCAEQLMPKNFVFFNPEHHQKLIALLERLQPAAILTATSKNPELVGALDPFPLFVDGDFDLPSVYCRDALGDILAGRAGSPFHLRIDARRIPSSAANVIARLNPEAAKKIVFTAHIDAYEGSLGASDNASGVAVLLLLAELLAGYRGAYGIEIAAFNGEDHYSVGGQMDYLRRYGDSFGSILAAVNIDDVGYVEGGTAYSFYGCPAPLEQRARAVFGRCEGLVEGEPWYSGDHMIFVQGQVPCLAFTAEKMPELMRTVTHTAADTPELVDGGKLGGLAGALAAWVGSL